MKASTSTLSSASSVSASDDEFYVQQTVQFLDATFASYPKSNFAFRLWEGTQWTKREHPSAVAPSFVVVLNHAGALRRMFLPPSDVRLGLAYTQGDFDIEGNAGEALNLGRHLWESWQWSDLFLSAYKLLRLPSSPYPSEDQHAPQLSGSVHSTDRDKRAVQFHYDVSNEFYQLWLDKRMVYSCGYFGTPNDSVDLAQVRKLEIVCRKLRLRKGDRLLDVGCGWGALIIHAVKRFGVRAIGVTLSEKQRQLVQERVQAAGLDEGMCRVELRDYRELEEEDGGTFDKIVSVGMVEHVGRYNLKEYFMKLYRLLRPGGLLLNHGITLLHDPFKPQWQVRRAFFAKYIFPDGDVQPVGYVLDAATNNTRFEIRDVECLREHYALTLGQWHERFERRREEIVRMVGVETYRLWWLYLLSAGWGFKMGLHSIYQTLFFKANEHSDAFPQLPLTRDDWYAEPIADSDSPSTEDCED